jgi:putative DNA primase/helicase
LDAYRYDYAGAYLLTREERQTVTAITGSGGEHLLYRMPDGERLGNHRAGLPSGIDVRGWNGYLVLAPSIHPDTGRAYAWEDGYSPFDMAPRDLPVWLAELLRAARPGSVEPVAFDADLPRPDLRALGLPRWAERRVFNVDPAEDRSVSDYAVVCELVRHGLDDDAIRAIFQHYPIGVDGKYASKNGQGDPYLALTIAKARGEVAAQPERNDTGLWLAAQLRDDGVSHTEAQRIMSEYQMAVELAGNPYTLGEAWDSLESAYARGARDPGTVGARTYANGDGPAPRLTAADATPPGPPVHARLTDVGNGERLAAMLGGGARYVHEWGWLTWTGAHWEFDHMGELQRMAKKTALSIYAEAAAASGTGVSQAMAMAAAGADAGQTPSSQALDATLGETGAHVKRIHKWAKDSQSAARIQAMIDMAASELGVVERSTSFDVDHHLLNVRNGTVDLATGKLRDARPADLITRCAPVDYDVTAKCPTWLAFLDRIMGRNGAMISFLQRAAGYSLSGDITEHVLLFCHGSGGNGKSTFLTTLITILGDYARQTSPDLLMVRQGEVHPTGLADLRGKRFVAAIETEEGKRLAESLVKQLTGGDPISARFMRQDFFNFMPECTLWLGANHKPVVRGTDYAIWRRIKLIPFTVTITESEKDANLPKRLLAEAPGILNWLLEGYREYLHLGLAVPETVAAATEGYRQDSDVFGDFLAACTVVNDKATAPAQKLYDAYGAWAAVNGVHPVVSSVRFAGLLQERGFAKGRVASGIIWYGIGLLAAIS